MTGSVLKAGQILPTMDAVVAHAREGASSREVLDLVARAARGSDGRDPEATFRAAYQALRDHFSFVHDPLGVELVQTPARTLSRGGGDCSSATPLVLAVAKAAGLRGRAVLVSHDREGVRVAEHVFPQVRIGGQWVPADLSEDLPIGTRATFTGTPVLETFDVDDEGAQRGVGFVGELFGGLIGGLVSIFNTREQRRAFETQANAERDAVVGQANAERDAILGLAREQGLATRAVSSHRLQEARTRANVAQLGIREASELAQDVLTVVTQTLPALLFLFLVRMLAPAARDMVSA